VPLSQPPLRADRRKIANRSRPNKADKVMSTSATGTSGTGDAEDVINGPPLEFRPVDEPEFIKRHRTSDGPHKGGIEDS